MTPERVPEGELQATAILAAQEGRLRVLHALRTEARLVDGFEAAYVGFVRTLRERLHPRGVTDIRTVTLDDGLILSVDVGDRLGCDVFYGYYEEAFDARIFTKSLQPGATVVDIGANFGFYALLSARAAGDASTIHAFEPDPNALQMLETNIVANGFVGRVVPWHVAVGEADGTVELQLAAESAFTSVRPTGRSEMRGSVHVSMRSLDSFAAEHGITSIDALKVDAEGLEGQILRGAQGLLRSSSDPVVLLEVSAKNLTDALQGELSDVLADLLGEGFVALRPDAGSPEGLRLVENASDIAHLSNTNVFLVRGGRATERRLRDVTRSEMGEPTPMLDVGHADADSRIVHVYEGVDPAVVASALDERDALRQQVAALTAKLVAVGELPERAYPDAERLRSENRDLTSMVQHLSATRKELRTTTEQGEAVVERQSAEVQTLRDAQQNAKRMIRRQDEQLAEAYAKVAQVQHDMQLLREESEAVMQRQSAEVAELRDALQQASVSIQRQQGEIATLRCRDSAEEQARLWREMVERQEAEVQQLRAAVELAQGQLEDWRALSERLVSENEDRRERLNDAQRRMFEKRELVDQLWAKLSAARADRDLLQARCTEQMHEIGRLREERTVRSVDISGNTARRLG